MCVCALWVRCVYCVSVYERQKCVCWVEAVEKSSGDSRGNSFIGLCVVCWWAEVEVEAARKMKRQFRCLIGSQSNHCNHMWTVACRAPACLLASRRTQRVYYE
jgi:hypothetical protein